MKFGIISFAHMHAHAYAAAINQLPGLELVGIADEDKARGGEVARQYETRHMKDYRDLLAEDIDAVVICSPNAHHREHAVAAAEAKKHILCEKPIATSIDDARAMIDAAEKAGVVLQTAFPVRHANPVRELKRAITSGALGEIIGINATNHGTMPPGWFLDKDLAGGGAVMDHTVHVADIVRWMLGAEFTNVYAEYDTLLHEVDVDDCGMLTMELSTGAIVSLDTSWSRPANFPIWGDVTMEVVGDKGSASLDTFSQVGTVYRATTEPGQGSVRYNGWGNNADLEMVKAFIAAIEGKPNDGASGWDGLKAMEVALGAYQSGRRGAPVSLPLDA